MRIGGHVSVAGGLPTAVERQRLIGGNCGQTFLSGPSSWRFTAQKPEAVAKFTLQAASTSINPWIGHAIYLVNLASPDERIWENSIASLTAHRQLGTQAGYLGIVLHTGSHFGAGLDTVLPRVVTALERILAAQEGGPKLLLEVTAGQGGAIGATFQELAAILYAMGDDQRLGVCWDTCHLYAAGFDIATPDGLTSTVDDFNSTIGWNRLHAIHANDSLFALGSHRDRHANIGEGAIGETGFGLLLNRSELRELPWLLEVPGRDRQGPDLDNINRLRRLAGLPLVERPAGTPNPDGPPQDES